MDIVDPKVEQYMRTLQARHDEPVLVEMEKEAEEKGFPIINRLCGVTVEVRWPMTSSPAWGARPHVPLVSQRASPTATRQPASSQARSFGSPSRSVTWVRRRTDGAAGGT